MKLSFGIAARFLRSNLTQTILIILGIGIGVSVQIFIGSLIQGLQKSLVETTVGNSSQITVTSDSETGSMKDYKDLMNRIQAADIRIIHISPVLDNPAIIGGQDETQSVLVRGFDLSKADTLYRISENIKSGRLPRQKGEVLLGTAIAEQFGYREGDTIQLVTPTKETVSCTISGFFDLKVAQINKTWCIASLETAQAMFQTGDTVSAIEMQVGIDRVFIADEAAANISSKLGTGYRVDNWKAQNVQLLSGLQGQSISSLMIQICVMVSVVLGISSTLAITVMQKSRQIGILKAMGIRNSKASLIFLMQGLILGVFGALAGVGFGIGLSAAFVNFAVRADGTPVVALFIDQNFILLSGIIAVLACLAASLIPARRSARLNPIDIIRNN